MGELRKDYFLDRYVEIASERGKRPHQFKKEPQDKHVDLCYFCPGNENMTPKEIGRMGDENHWYIRWFDNKFPAVSVKGNPIIKTDNTYFTYSGNFGKHEVIVESPNHFDDLADLSVEHIKDILKVYSMRIEKLEMMDGIRYVNVFKNHKKEAGTSIIHTHSQIIALNMVPPVVKEKVDKSFDHGKCRYCDVVNIEKDSLRRILENDTFVSFTPYASRFPMEAWILPKQHKKRLDDLSDHEYHHLAEILKHLLVKLKSIDAAFNMFVFYAPKNSDLHFHIEIAPRLATWAGFEHSSGVIINAVSPEEAAKFYRGEE